MNKLSQIFIGFDPRESDAFLVARSSVQRYLSAPIPVYSLVLRWLRQKGLYTRPTSRLVNNQMWDDISNAPMSTEFAISRFLIPHLVREQRTQTGGRGWALFMDCDVMLRTSVARLFELADDSKAVMVVKHLHAPTSMVKMDAQVQTAYPRKNWSSVMLINCDHPANDKLTPELVNTLPGRDLHRFCWLEDDMIGELPVEWNWLAGTSDTNRNPHLVHFTDGVPTMPGCEKVPYAASWWLELQRAVGAVA